MENLQRVDEVVGYLEVPLLNPRLCQRLRDGENDVVGFVGIRLASAIEIFRREDSGPVAAPVLGVDAMEGFLGEHETAVVCTSGQTHIVGAAGLPLVPEAYPSGWRKLVVSIKGSFIAA